MSLQYSLKLTTIITRRLPRSVSISYVMMGKDPTKRLSITLKWKGSTFTHVRSSSRTISSINASITEATTSCIQWDPTSTIRMPREISKTWTDYQRRSVTTVLMESTYSIALRLIMSSRFTTRSYRFLRNATTSSRIPTRLRPIGLVITRVVPRQSTLFTRAEGSCKRTEKYLGFHGLRNTSNVMTTEFKRVAAAINKMEEAVGINQHHDAITGTAKQHVTDNYIKILNDGTEILRSIVHEVAAEQTSNEIKEDVQYEYCSWNTTSSACEITSTNLTNNEAVLLAVFNPAAARKSVIRVKVPHGNLSVIDMENDELTVDVICPEEDDDSDCDLFFFTSLPAFDMSYFKIVPSDDSKELTGKPARTWSYHSVTYRINDEETLRFLTKLNEFEIKRCSRRHSAIHNKPVGHCSFQKLVLDYNYYPSGQRNAQNSGAYVFVNEENIKEPKPYVEWNSATVYEGQVVVQMYYPLTTIVASLRIYRNMSEAYELETYVAPLNTTGTFGSEIVLRLTTLIENEGIFYTDSNGMEMQMRVINNRPSWKWNLTETVAGNYYPVQSAIQIRDKSNRGMLTVVPDRAQGGTSLNPGQVELMIQRKLEVDDGRGVGEALKEDHFIPNTGETVPIIATMIHRIILTKPGEWEYDWRNVQWDQDQPNILMLAPTDTATFNITTRKPQSQNFGFKQLPRLVKVWIRPYDEKVFVVRFQNMGDKKTEEVIVDDKWTHMNWDERSLTTNQQKKIMHAKRMRWNDMQAPPQENKDYKDGNIRLRPQEIRTFVVWNY
eukprot:TRINITY_DN3415_c0_g1_i6.p1 TRINITY_DN3415_c0_g1~~TRINITY_DN3415_c0_g1_i6.p1  ORF type:complete len:779 (+),score=127.44 TRINITY_DN3415_c0_g1_i6:782-3118(+)